MATRKKTDGQKSSEPLAEPVRFSVEPGARVQITLDVGETTAEGKVPLTVHIEQVGTNPGAAVEIALPEPRSLPGPAAPAPAPARRRAAWELLKSRARAQDLAAWLFILALGVYLATRLVGLTHFPIYFFTDEASQSLSIIDLIANGYRDPSGVLLPTYFRNGDYYNIGLSVYLQWLPALIFGKSAVATRATSVLVTLLAAVSVGLILRDVFRLKYWWTGTLFLSITPAWFLHSRTAFETAEFVAFYAGTLCAYLFYRYRSPRYLYLTVFLGALSFYTYSPGQVIVPLTGLGLLLSDWRYHRENRRIVLIGLAMAVVLSLPYLRYSVNHPSAAAAHLHTLYSYWFEKISLSEKIARYLSEFGIGLSPWYWYVPNDRDLPRHLMKEYGNIMLATLPFALLGLAHALRRLHEPAYRAVLLALFVSPAAAALVQISITRTLVFLIPAAILTAIGLELVLGWIEDPRRRILEISEGPEPTPLRNAAALAILGIGIYAASFLRESINGLAVWVLASLLALQVSLVLKRLAQSAPGVEPAALRPWKGRQTVLALGVFVILAGASVRMLGDALRNGPLWFRDYGLGGMQYGAFQIFDILNEYRQDHPEAQIIFSPDWANGADVLARYLLDDFSSIQMGSVRGHITQKLPLDKETLFVMTPQEYELVRLSPKFTAVRAERIVPYPDGSPGFYFVRLRYVEHIDEIFAAEKAVRQALRETTLPIDGEDVGVRFSYLDSEFQEQWIALVFDNDPFTVAKTFETNPFVIEMTFPQARTLNGFSIIIGSASVEITVKCYGSPGADPLTYTFEGQGTREQPKLSFDLPEAARARIVRFEVRDVHAPDTAKVHIWELKLR